MGFVELLKKRAKESVKTIVLPETEDMRTLEATDKILKEGVAKIILIGNEEEINKFITINIVANLNDFVFQEILCSQIGVLCHTQSWQCSFIYIARRVNNSIRLRVPLTTSSIY